MGDARKAFRGGLQQECGDNQSEAGGVGREVTGGGQFGIYGLASFEKLYPLSVPMSCS